MKTHKTLKIAIPSMTFLAFLRERFPELPADAKLEAVNCYNGSHEVKVEVHCEFDPPESNAN